jgi:2,3-bisphosphoglycerate-dependent phosphoglycerate mutase
MVENNLIFVRHGESSRNLTLIMSTDNDKYPLTVIGRQQAQVSALVLKEILRKRFNSGLKPHIYTSPILRAKQTAHIIAEQLEGTVHDTLSLAERGFGKYNNTDFVTEDKLVSFKREQIRRGYPDLESWNSMQYRILKFSESISYEKRLVIAVSHFDPIRPIVGYFLNKNELDMWNMNIPLCSLTMIDFSKIGRKAVITVGNSALH